jgi:DnaK suppressor protein
MYPEVRFSDAELADFEALLRDKRSKLIEELETLDKLNKGHDGATMGYSSHLTEEGSDMNAYETNFALAQRQGDYLQYVEEALDRIKRKTYGICKVCNELIESQRLKAVPTTTTHVGCKGTIKEREAQAVERARARAAIARQGAASES